MHEKYEDLSKLANDRREQMNGFRDRLKLLQQQNPERRYQQSPQEDKLNDEEKVMVIDKSSSSSQKQKKKNASRRTIEGEFGENIEMNSLTKSTNLENNSPFMSPIPFPKLESPDQPLPPINVSSKSYRTPDRSREFSTSSRVDSEKSSSTLGNIQTIHNDEKV